MPKKNFSQHFLKTFDTQIFSGFVNKKSLKKTWLILLFYIKCSTIHAYTALWALKNEEIAVYIE